jgi:hypothetical protein
VQQTAATARDHSLLLLIKHFLARSPPAQQLVQQAPLYISENNQTPSDPHPTMGWSPAGQEAVMARRLLLLIAGKCCFSAIPSISLHI